MRASGAEMAGMTCKGLTVTVCTVILATRTVNDEGDHEEPGVSKPSSYTMLN